MDGRNLELYISGANCDGFLSSDPAAQRVVTLSDLRFVFVLMAVGLAAGTITLFIEKMCKSELSRKLSILSRSKSRTEHTPSNGRTYNQYY